MSGVTGNEPIKSRKVFKQILKEYKQDLLQIPGIENIQVSGSFVSDPNKQEFGDMDLILTVQGSDKKTIKKDLQKILKNHSGLRPFVSEKYRNRRTYNSGEIITISYQQGNNRPCQIDNIISLSRTEANFKLNFLNLPAEKQGLLLGVVKIANQETRENKNKNLDQEIEYNLSSQSLQKRLVSYYPGTTKEQKRTILSKSTDWSEVLGLTSHLIDLNRSFEEILEQIKKLSPRSIRRIKGVFKSMVSIKSGEVNKPKGLRKQYCLDLVNEL